ncbi:MAG: hypothetical protein WCQ95_06740 [Bacteroidota bacterium]
MAAVAKTSLFGLIPFGLQALILVSGTMEGGSRVAQAIMLCFAIAGFMFICGYSWVAIFPRWTFPALGFSFICSFLVGYSMYIGNVHRYCALLFLLPMTLAFVAGFCMKPTLKPIKYLFWLFKADKSIMLFWFYGFAPAFISLLFDSITDVWLVPVTLLITAICATGAFFYLESSSKTVRILSLFLGAFVGFAVAIIYISGYWMGRG